MKQTIYGVYTERNTGDSYEEYFYTKEEAMNYAINDEFEYLTEHDRKKVNNIYVVGYAFDFLSDISKMSANEVIERILNAQFDDEDERIKVSYDSPNHDSAENWQECEDGVIFTEDIIKDGIKAYAEN